MSTYTRRTQGSVGRLLALAVVLLVCLTPDAVPAGVGTRLFLPVLHQDSPVRVIDARLMQSRGGIVDIVGTLVQHTALPITDIVVRVRLVLPAPGGSSFTRTRTGTTLIPVALPGQPLPFIVGLDTDYVISFDAEVVAWSAAPQAPERALSVPSLTLIDRVGTSATFDVVVQNDTAMPLTNMKLLLWSIPFGESGVDTNLPGTLAPGERITVRTSRRDIEPEGAIAIAQGTVVP